MQLEHASMQWAIKETLKREEAAKEELRQVQAEMAAEELAAAKAAYIDWCATHGYAQDVQACARGEEGGLLRH